MKPTTKQNARIELVGTEALTLLQAGAILKAGLAVLSQIHNGVRDDFTGREAESLSQAIGKLEFRVRDHVKEPAQ